MFAQPPYVKTVHKEIKNDLLLTTGENLTVEIPTPKCILADKLTAFAPHTTGVLLGEKKELEIAKQLFDITNLIDHITDYQTVLDTYCKTVADETRFRGEKWTVKDVLEDTIDACLSILSRGRIGKEDYKEYLHGIKSLKNYVLLENYSTDNITWETCKVMYLASCLLSEKQYQNIKNSDCYITEQIENPEYVKLTYIRKQNLLAYAYLVEAVRNLAFVSNISLMQQEQITKKIITSLIFDISRS